MANMTIFAVLFVVFMCADGISGAGTKGGTPCQMARNRVNSKFLGAFVPQCTPDGSFEAKQCHGSTGFCWCVNPLSGRRIRGTRQRLGRGNITCDGCSYKGRTYTQGQRFISKEGSSETECSSCVCAGPNRIECLPLCDVVHCQYGQAGFTKVKRAPGCYCKKPVCLGPSTPMPITANHGCKFEGRRYSRSERFIAREGWFKNSCHSCICYGSNHVSCVPTCENVAVRCKKGQVRSVNMIERGPGCMCREESCLSLSTQMPMTTIMHGTDIEPTIITETETKIIFTDRMYTDHDIKPAGPAFSQYATRMYQKDEAKMPMFTVAREPAGPAFSQYEAKMPMFTVAREPAGPAFSQYATRMYQKDEAKMPMFTVAREPIHPTPRTDARIPMSTVGGDGCFYKGGWYPKNRPFNGRKGQFKECQSCFCDGNNRVRCMPMCEPLGFGRPCMEGQMRSFRLTRVHFMECNCKVPICLDASTQRPMTTIMDGPLGPPTMGSTQMPPLMDVRWAVTSHPQEPIHPTPFTEVPMPMSTAYGPRHDRDRCYINGRFHRLHQRFISRNHGECLSCACTSYDILECQPCSGRSTQTPRATDGDVHIRPSPSTHGPLGPSRSHVNPRRRCGGTISSPTHIRYPTNGMYPNRMDCTWNIQIGKPFKLQFKTFDLERSSTCKFDYVRVGGGERRCGTNIPPDTYSENGTLDLVFHSDGSVRFPGFEVEIVLGTEPQRPDTTPRPQEPDSTPSNPVILETIRLEQ